MKSIYILAGSALIASLFVLALTLGDFLALTDIRRDYVSKDIPDSLGIALSARLPIWTTTAGEWAMVQISHLARSAFLILNIITLTVIQVLLRFRDRARTEPA